MEPVPVIETKAGSTDLQVEDIDAQDGRLSWTDEEESHVRRKIDFRVVPWIVILYLMCFLDRFVTPWFPLTHATSLTDMLGPQNKHWVGTCPV